MVMDLEARSVLTMSGLTDGKLLVWFGRRVCVCVCDGCCVCVLFELGYKIINNRDVSLAVPGENDGF